MQFAKAAAKEVPPTPPGPRAGEALRQDISCGEAMSAQLFCLLQVFVKLSDHRYQEGQTSPKVDQESADPDEEGSERNA